MTSPVLMTAAEVAVIVREKPITVAKWCRQGKLRATRPGRGWRIARADLDEFLAAHRNDDERVPA